MLHAIRRKYPKGGFARNVLTLMVGTTIAQAIPFAISPILSRIYSPKEFGLFTLFTSIASMMNIVATGRYEMAIMLPEDEADAVNLVALSGRIVFVISLLALLILLFFNHQIAHLMKNDQLAVWLFLIPFTVLFTGTYQALSYWSNRKKQYQRLSTSKVTLALSTAVTNIVLGLLSKGVLGLIVGGVIGQALATFVLGIQVWRDDSALARCISKQKIRENARRYQDFPKINSFHAFLDIVQLSGVSILLSMFFGDSVLGKYSLTLRIIQAPLGLIGTSVSQVFFQKASELHQNTGDLYGLVKRTMVRMCLLSIPVVAVILLLGPQIFSFVFGSQWSDAGNYARLLSPWIFMKFIVSPISQVPIIVNKQKIAFIWGVFINLSTLVLLVVSSKLFNSIDKSLLVLSGFSFCITFAYGIWMLQLVKKKQA